MLTLLAACLLLHNTTVIDPASADVRVRDGIIRDRRVAEGHCDQRVDLTGKFVLPGFVDMHAHLFLNAWDKDGNLRRNWDREDMVREGHVVGPTIITAGRIINSGRLDSEPFVQLTTEDEVRRQIRWQAAAGVDVIKIYAAISPELARVAIEEAHSHHLPIIGHLQRTSWAQAAEMGIDGVEHAADWSEEELHAEKRAAYDNSMFGRVYWLENLDPETVDRTIAALKAHHVVVDPTLMAIHTKFFGNSPRWLQNPDNALMPQLWLEGWKSGSFTRDWTPAQYAEAQRAWPKLLAFVKKIYDAGVPMVVGTDTPTPWIVPGASLHDEMSLLHDAGIPTMAILKMATRPIKTSSPADLVVLTANPLDDIRNTRSIAAVYKNGVPIND